MPDASVKLMPMQCIEYRTEVWGFDVAQSRLNDLGAEGWELCGCLLVPVQQKGSSTLFTPNGGAPTVGMGLWCALKREKAQ